MHAEWLLNDAMKSHAVDQVTLKNDWCPIGSCWQVEQNARAKTRGERARRRTGYCTSLL